MADETNQASERSLYPDDAPPAAQSTPALAKAVPGTRAEPTEGTHPRSASDEKSEVDTLYPDDKPGAETNESPFGAPTAYTYKMPEGLEMSREIMAEVEPVFRGLNLSNEGANRLMPLAGKFYERIIDGQADEYSAMKADWAKTVGADPELGKGNLDETRRYVGIALEKAGAGQGSEFRKLMNDSGIGDNPEMVRVFRRLGKLLADKV